jgi:hypothetical protein
MATGISAYLANAWLDALGNATSFSVTTAYVKLHVGDPGAETAQATLQLKQLVSLSVSLLHRLVLWLRMLM